MLKGTELIHISQPVCLLHSPAGVFQGNKNSHIIDGIYIIALQINIKAKNQENQFDGSCLPKI